MEIELRHSAKGRAESCACPIGRSRRLVQGDHNGGLDVKAGRFERRQVRPVRLADQQRDLGASKDHALGTRPIP